MRLALLALLLLASGATAAPPRLKVSDNKRYLVTCEGKPFFYLADTAWELFHRLTREEADEYLKDRAAKGFTVVQAVVLAEFAGLTEPNAYGQLPLVGGAPAKPNDKYFEHVDWVTKRATELGLTVAMLPSWGDKWNKKWGEGPEVFTPENAQGFGEYVGARYKDAGVIWVLGGDRPTETEAHKSIIRAMATGLKAGDGGNHLMTFHPTGGAGSASVFHADDWLDFNMRQNGHAIDYTGRYDQTKADYDRTPVKPVLDGEPVYEAHPVAFDAKKFGHTVAADARRAFYWDVFSGACGHTYGHHSVWQMYAPGRKPVNNPLNTWREAINDPGAAQMGVGRKLIESRPYLTRIPDDSLLVPEAAPTAVPGAGTRRYVATRDSAGSFAMVYAPVGRPFAVRFDKLGGATLRAWWFDPRTGNSTLIGEFPRAGEKRFAPPSPGELLDWVLVLDDAAKDYPAPGTARK